MSADFWRKKRAEQQDHVKGDAKRDPIAGDDRALGDPQSPMKGKSEPTTPQTPNNSVEEKRKQKWEEHDKQWTALKTNKIAPGANWADMDDEWTGFDDLKKTKQKANDDGKDKRIEELENVIETKDGHIKELVAEVDAKNRRIYELAGIVDHKEEYIKELVAQVDEKDRRARELETQLELQIQSTKTLEEVVTGYRLQNKAEDTPNPNPNDIHNDVENEAGDSDQKNSNGVSQSSSDSSQDGFVKVEASTASENGSVVDEDEEEPVDLSADAQSESKENTSPLETVPPSQTHTSEMPPLPKPTVSIKAGDVKPAPKLSIPIKNGGKIDPKPASGWNATCSTEAPLQGRSEKLDIRDMKRSQRAELFHGPTITVIIGRETIRNVPKVLFMTVSPRVRNYFKENPGETYIPFKVGEIAVPVMQLIKEWLTNMGTCAYVYSLKLRHNIVEDLAVRRDCHYLGMEKYVTHFTKQYCDRIRDSFIGLDNIAVIEKNCVHNDNVWRCLVNNLLTMRLKKQIPEPEKFADFLKEHPRLAAAMEKVQGQLHRNQAASSNASSVDGDWTPRKKTPNKVKEGEKKEIGVINPEENGKVAKKGTGQSPSSPMKSKASGKTSDLAAC